MRNRQATATINKEVEITVGNPTCYETYIVGFTITANIDVGTKDSWDTPGTPPSVDEWVDLKIEYSQPSSSLPGKESGWSIFEKHILELAEVADMEWVDDYDEEEYE